MRPMHGAPAEEVGPGQKWQGRGSHLRHYPGCQATGDAVGFSLVFTGKLFMFEQLPRMRFLH